MSLRIAHVWLASLCLLGSAMNVAAQPSPIPNELGGIVYITGGIGADEVSSYREVASQYNLRITLTSKTGEYLSDVDVAISSGARSVLKVRTAGPFLYARVPPGRYTVLARDRNLHETRQVMVPARGGVNVSFSWEEPDRRDVMHMCSNCPRARHRATD
ncbi:hypothetical protein [Burkholderia stagnalis]|uniref:hypothetical protein n=1 Tax=Burkholderia stagnalis TaxID=1503054 RepID=UPI0009BF2B88|nr:hypothetical protein [Burkholderia stagnalis]